VQPQLRVTAKTPDVRRSGDGWVVQGCRFTPNRGATQSSNARWDRSGGSNRLEERLDNPIMATHTCERAMQFPIPRPARVIDVNICCTRTYGGGCGRGAGAGCQNGMEAKVRVGELRHGVASSKALLAGLNRRRDNTKPVDGEFEASSRRFRASTCRFQASIRQIEAPNRVIPSFKSPIRSFNSSNRLRQTASRVQTYTASRPLPFTHRPLVTATTSKQQRNGFAKPSCTARSTIDGSHTPT
jgi:hypothetical protein